MDLSYENYVIITQNGNEMNSDESILGSENQIDGTKNQQQQIKKFQGQIEKMKAEFKDIKQLSEFEKLKAENVGLKAELKHQKLQTENNELKAKVAKMEQENAKKLEENRRENGTKKGDFADQLTKLGNDQTKLLERIGELEKQIKISEQKKRQQHMELTAKFDEMKQKQMENSEKLQKIEGKTLPKVDEVFLNPSKNCWNSEACHGDLAIMGGECLMVHYKKEGNGYRTLFAKCPFVPNHFGISYYEVKIMNMKGFICIGFATKQLPLDKRVASYSNSYSYTSCGTFWINGSIKGAKPTFVRDDVVGCGVNLATGQIIFTKNGQQLDTADLFVSPTDHLLFPCVTLWKCGDLIEANFGPDFKFNPSDV